MMKKLTTLLVAFLVTLVCTLVAAQPATLFKEATSDKGWSEHERTLLAEGHLKNGVLPVQFLAETAYQVALVKGLLSTKINKEDFTKSWLEAHGLRQGQSLTVVEYRASAQAGKFLFWPPNLLLTADGMTVAKATNQVQGRLSTKASSTKEVKTDQVAELGVRVKVLEGQLKLIRDQSKLTPAPDLALVMASVNTAVTKANESLMSRVLALENSWLWPVLLSTLAAVFFLAIVGGGLAWLRKTEHKFAHNKLNDDFEIRLKEVRSTLERRFAETQARETSAIKQTSVDLEALKLDFTSQMNTLHSEVYRANAKTEASLAMFQKFSGYRELILPKDLEELAGKLTPEQPDYEFEVYFRDNPEDRCKLIVEYRDGVRVAISGIEEQKEPVEVSALLMTIVRAGNYGFLVGVPSATPSDDTAPVNESEVVESLISSPAQDQVDPDIPAFLKKEPGVT